MSNAQFILTEKVKAMIPMYDQYGKPCTYILSENDWITVQNSMENIVDFNLRRRFSSLRGMKDSVKGMLKNADFYPIVITDTLPLVLFATDSERSGKAILLALHQIFDMKAVDGDDQRATVYFYGGQSLTIPAAISKLEKRRARAHKARSYYFQSYYMIEHQVEAKVHKYIVFDGVSLKCKD